MQTIIIIHYGGGVDSRDEDDKKDTLFEVRESFLIVINEDRLVLLRKVHTKDNTVDMFAKALPVGKLNYCLNLICLVKC